jgi:ribosomal protein S15P/S13E
MVYMSEINNEKSDENFRKFFDIIEKYSFISISKTKSQLDKLFRWVSHLENDIEFLNKEINNLKNHGRLG